MARQAEGAPPYARIAVGSANPAKVAAARTALARIAPAADVVTVEVAGGVPLQPVGDAETRAGALERARRAIRAADADLGIGLEGGVVHDADRTWLVSWAAVVDREGRVGEAGARMPLPAATRTRLLAGEELGPIIDDLFGVVEAKTQSGAIGLLTRGAVTRTEAFAQLIGMALAPHLHPGLYRSDGRARA
ncbi:MAG TPA: inosine/xanthosine triphosphatase [Candidatus Limnocylindria bacterium]|nr:inosine/xanthosine triphosphatase [Candidatus Limnocylindria bacterium]